MRKVLVFSFLVSALCLAGSSSPAFAADFNMNPRLASHAQKIMPIRSSESKVIPGAYHGAANMTNKSNRCLQNAGQRNRFASSVAFRIILKQFGAGVRGTFFSVATGARFAAGTGSTREGGRVAQFAGPSGSVVNMSSFKSDRATIVIAYPKVAGCSVDYTGVALRAN